MMRIYEYGQVSRDEIFARVEPEVDVTAVVREILADVRSRGDAALYDYCRRFDRADLTALEVTPEEWDAAIRNVDQKLLAVLEQSAKNIEAFHRRQVRTDFVITDRPGMVLGQKITPLQRVGLYIPGGTACCSGPAGFWAPPLFCSCSGSRRWM